MNGSLIVYATLKTIHDKKKNVLDSFLPFVERSLYQHKNDSLNISMLQSIVNDEFQIEIPKNTLISLLNILVKNKLVSIYNENIEIKSDLHKQNDSYVLYYENSKRDINQFLNDYKIFCKNCVLADELLLKHIYDFIIYSTNYFNVLNEIPADAIFNPAYQELVQFITYIKNSNNQLFNIFKNILYGALLINLLDSNNSIRQFQSSLSVFLDTSYLFRILELQNPFFNSAAMELFDIMKNNNFKFYTFEQNFTELRTKLMYVRKNMLNEEFDKDRVYEIEQIDGVEGSILRNFKSFALLDDFISDLPNKIKNLKIEIVPTRFLDDIKDFENLEHALTRFKIYKDYYKRIKSRNREFIRDDIIFESDLLNYDNANELVADIKKRIIEKSISEKSINIPDYDSYYNSLPEYAINSYKSHSMLSAKVIKYIRDKRTRNFDNFTECKCFYLTSDNSLFKFNNKKHMFNHTIPEIMLDRLVTNVLWTFNPTIIGDVPIKQVLAAFQTSNFINLDDLEKFFEFVKHYSNSQPSETKFLDNVVTNQLLPYELNKMRNNNPEANDDDIFDKVLKEMINKSKETHETSETIINNIVDLSNILSNIISWFIFFILLGIFAVQLIVSIIPNITTKNFSLAFWINLITSLLIVIYNSTFGSNLNGFRKCLHDKISSGILRIFTKKRKTAIRGGQY